MGHRDVFVPGVVLQELEAFFCEFSLTFASATTPVQVDVKPDIPQKARRIIFRIALEDFNFWRPASGMGGLRWTLSLFSRLFNFI